MSKPVKGQAVWVLALWSFEGVFSFKPAMVYSAGAKQMVLASPEGVKFGGQFFWPGFGPMPAEARKLFRAAEVIVASREEAEARALQLSKEWIAGQIAHYEFRLERAVALACAESKAIAEKELVRLAGLKAAAVEKALMF